MTRWTGQGNSLVIQYLLTNGGDMVEDNILWRILFVILNTICVLAIPYVFFTFLFGMFGFWDPPTLSTKIQGIVTLVIYLLVVFFVNKWLLKRIDMRGWKLIFLVLIVMIIVAILSFSSEFLFFYFQLFFVYLMSFFGVELNL